jgi:hypothetical protein
MAYTFTDGNGFCLLCGLPQTRIVSSNDPYDGGFYVTVDASIPVVEAGTNDVVLNIEMKNSARQSLRSRSLDRLSRSVGLGYRKKR